MTSAGRDDLNKAIDSGRYNDHLIISFDDFARYLVAVESGAMTPEQVEAEVHARLKDYDYPTKAVR